MSTPAGWYDDTENPGSLRYWDGAVWTDHRHTPEAPAPAAFPPPAGDIMPAVAPDSDRTAKIRGAAAAAFKSGLDTNGAVFVGTSHDEGRNATVALFPDRIERVRAKKFGSFSNAKQDVEMTPIKSVSSVQAKKDGFYTKVFVYASGNTVEFRLSHAEAAVFKAKIQELVLAPAQTLAPQVVVAPAAAAPDLAEQLHKLAGLRDAGILSQEEFDAKKADILSRM